ncbi:hypothetical protein CAOG_000251 [Capsaspora owczarzaki ATCC 30864]|uniref:ADP,ATP carrier protein n=2 Tax=Capsaspora owczarzaki (strain ATCC 30864) TaxID=595528 RepID=A0A0D2WGR4_CAPO3|nr:hypothetical protein CAOG_000251 [Capsaspora owczarzaki ATCC 30864]
MTAALPRWAQLALHTVGIKPESDPLRVIGYAFCLNFCTLTSLYIIQPLRDELAASEGGIESLPWLFMASLLVMLGANRIMARVAHNRSPARVALLAFRSFITALIAFKAALWLARGHAAVTSSLAIVFFLWSGSFTLLSMSLDWSLISLSFTSVQSTQFFGLIAAGGTLGQIFGSFLTLQLIEWTGTTALLLVAAGFLVGSLHCIRALGQTLAFHPTLPHAGTAVDGPAPTGNTTSKHPPLWRSLQAVAHSPLLVGICVHVMLFTFTASTLYFRKQQILLDSISEGDSRTGFRATLNGLIGIMTFFLQLFGTRRITAKFGMSVALCVVPLMSITGFAVLWQWPQLSTISMLVFLRKVLGFALDKPSRESLFTRVAPSERLMVKNLIDTVIFRVGDALGASVYLLQVPHHTTPAASPASAQPNELAMATPGPAIPLEAIAIAASCCWLGVCWYLGFLWRRDHARAAQHHPM